MTTVNVVEAKANLSELLRKVEAGEEIIITKRGRPIAKIAAVEKKLRPIQSLAEFRSTMPRSKESSAKLLRVMRDDDY